MRRPLSTAPMVYGPDVIGYSVTISSKGLCFPSGPRPHARENTGRAVPSVSNVSVPLSLRSKRIVRSFSTTARSTPASAVW